MDSFLVFLCFASLCGAPYVQDLDPQLLNVNNNQSQPIMSGNQLPPMWSGFRWDATGSYSASGTISNQIIYPITLMNPSGDLYFAIDVDAQVIKMNFTVGGMQKTTVNGTHLTFAPGGQCWFIKNWTYADQIQAYTFATLKHNFGDSMGLFTGNVEDVSSCATTIATALLTKKNRVVEWEFQGGFLTSLGATNFDYQLVFNSFAPVIPQTNNTYWETDASCHPPNVVSHTLCTDTFPFGCSSFLAAYKPEGNHTPPCQNPTPSN